ncbi:hypothetical protein PENSPDRAFT_716280 [Peniophora sp. CONT]|nr:hypothetical protein PENSPDRAFT_716280 [Peniophora sp. CONT]
MLLLILRHLDVPGVPSYKSYRKARTFQAQEMGITSKLQKSALSNHFYTIDPHVLFGLDWSNPLVRKHIHQYPNIASNGTVTETWEASKWLEEADLAHLSPMWADWKNTPSRHFYVNELALMKDQSAVVPLRWVTVDGIEHFDGHPACRDSMGKIIIQDDVTVRLPASDLDRNWLDLKAQYARDWIQCMPNPLREIAKGRPLFTIRCWLWGDDVSGNVSKQYNAHTNEYLANASLPHHCNRQQYFIRFSSTSQHASCPELFAAAFADMTPDKWHEAYDCFLGRDILFRVLPHGLPADNPQQAETASVVGPKGYKNCRFDQMGGSEEQRETNDGFHAHFVPGEPRNPASTIATIMEMYRLASYGNKSRVDELSTETGVTDRIADYWLSQVYERARDLQKARISDKHTQDSRLRSTSKKNPINKPALRDELRDQISCETLEWLYSQPDYSLLSLPADSPLRRSLRPGDHYNAALSAPGVDPHRDAPLEKLHTKNIGSDKYAWYETTKDWKPDHESAFVTRLSSSSIDGLTIGPVKAQYMVKYKHNIVGRHYKALAQLAPFHLFDDLCTENMQRIWRAGGELGALLWFTDIEDMSLYCADLKIAVDNLLDTWCTYDARRLITKMKLHVFPHAPEGVKRFGPASIYETEGYEAFNSIFRSCSVLSNHLAPSRDIADQIIAMERFKHLVSGGWWRNKDGEAVRAGRLVREFLQDDPDLQRQMGWKLSVPLRPGTIKLVSQKRRQKLSSATILAGTRKAADNTVDELRREHLDSLSQFWIRCIHSISLSHETVFPGSWVMYKGNVNDPVLCGRVLQIIVPASSPEQAGTAVLLIEHFNIGNTREGILGTPILYGTHTLAQVKPMAVLFKINVQHDCRHGMCAISTRKQHIPQERILVERDVQYVDHAATDRYLINTFALHNAAALRRVLPRRLTQPVPFYPPEERRAKHDEFAADLRRTGPAKRAETKAKTAATREVNKQRKNAQSAAANPGKGDSAERSHTDAEQRQDEEPEQDADDEAGSD